MLQEHERGYLWTEEIPHGKFGATLLQAASNRELERVSALIEALVVSFPETARRFLSNIDNAKYYIYRGVPEQFLIDAARRLGEYTLAREITAYTVSADA